MERLDLCSNHFGAGLEALVEGLPARALQALYVHQNNLPLRTSQVRAFFSQKFSLMKNHEN